MLPDTNDNIVEPRDHGVLALKNVIIVEDYKTENGKKVVKVMVSGSRMNPTLGWVLLGVTGLYMSILIIRVCRGNH